MSPMPDNVRTALMYLIMFTIGVTNGRWFEAHRTPMLILEFAMIIAACLLFWDGLKHGLRPPTSP